MPPLGLFMDAKSSSSGFTSAEELDSSNSGQRQGDDDADVDAGSVPRRWGAGPGQRKGKNRDAARKSRKKQTAKADELHKEHQCLERSNKSLVKEIAALQAEVQRYTVVLERHEPSCRLLAASRSDASMLPLASTSNSIPTPTPTTACTSIIAATREWGSSHPCETPPLNASSSSSSSSSIINLFNSHLLPPLASSTVRPSSFTPPQPAPGPNRHFRSELESLELSATGGTPTAVLPPHSQGAPAPFYPRLEYPTQGSPGSISVHGYPTGSPGTVFPPMSSGHAPHRGLTPGNLLLPSDIFDHFDVLMPGASMGMPAPSFSELMPTLWDLCSDTSLSQLLQPDDWYQDC